MSKKDDGNFDDTKKIHQYWYSFAKHFGSLYGIGFDGNVLSEKMVGSDCMDELDKYVKKHPEVVLVPTDDSVFASSYFVLVPHPDMGITIIFVPQCTTVQNQMFMYPRHSDILIEEIAKMKKKYNI